MISQIIAAIVVVPILLYVVVMDLRDDAALARDFDERESALRRVAEETRDA